MLPGLQREQEVSVTLAQWADIAKIVVNALIAGTVVTVIVLIRKAIGEQKEALRLRNEYLEGIAVKDWREQLKALSEEHEDKLQKTIAKAERSAAEERDDARLERIELLMLMEVLEPRDRPGFQLTDEGKNALDELKKARLAVLAETISRLETVPPEKGLERVHKTSADAVRELMKAEKEKEPG